MSFERTDKIVAAFDFIGHTGAKNVEVRYSEPEHEGSPTVWMGIVTYMRNGQPVYEVDAALTPERAMLRLCERLADGGECTHCHRPTGFEPDHLDRMPLDEVVCWYQFDPETKKFRRGCSGDVP